MRAPADEEHGVETYSALWGTNGAVARGSLAVLTTAFAALAAAARIGPVPIAGAARGARAAVHRRGRVASFASRRPAAASDRADVRRLDLLMYLGLGAAPLALHCGGERAWILGAADGARVAARRRQGQGPRSGGTRRTPGAGVVRVVRRRRSSRASHRNSGPRSKPPPTAAALGACSRPFRRRLPSSPRSRRRCVSSRRPARLVAVRSSASDEDGTEHSFAGQLESFLNVPPADVAARCARSGGRASADRDSRLPARARPAAAAACRRRCWSSAWSAARRRRGVRRRSGQRPPRLAVVSAVPGSAPRSSRARPTPTLAGRSAGRIVERRIVTKLRMHVADAASPGGVRTADVPAPLASSRR